MRVFVTGATGFIGRALIPRLQRDGHAVVAWVRSQARARSLLGAEVELVPADTTPDGLAAAIERSDAVVNLAGEALDQRADGARAIWQCRQRHVETLADVLPKLTGQPAAANVQ